MTDIVTAQAGTALSPEWDRGFDRAFTDLVSSDPDLVRSEFDALIDACWNEPPPPDRAAPEAAPGPADGPEPAAPQAEGSPGDVPGTQRYPP